MFEIFSVRIQHYVIDQIKCPSFYIVISLISQLQCWILSHLHFDCTDFLLRLCSETQQCCFAAEISRTLVRSLVDSDQTVTPNLSPVTLIQRLIIIIIIQYYILYIIILSTKIYGSTCHVCFIFNLYIPLFLYCMAIRINVNFQTKSH